MSQLEAILRRRGPVYVDPFLAAGGAWLYLVSLDLVPLVSWMGGKRRMAHRIMELLGLDPGTGVPAILGDLSWWGWVWTLLLDPEAGPLVAAWLRGWQGEDPRALWFRLRDAGPPADPVERAAGLLWLQARAASGVPVWWEGDPGGWWEQEEAPGELVSMNGDGNAPYRAWQKTGPPARLVSMDGHGRGPYRAWQATGLPKLLQWGASKIDDAGQRQAREPRLLQGPRLPGEDRGAGQCSATEPRLLASDGRGVPREAGHKANKSGEDNRTGGMVNPGTIADRIDAVRLLMAGRPGAAPKAADMGRNDGHREKHGWRAFEPGDVAGRLHRIQMRTPDVVVAHCDAFDLVRAVAPLLGPRARIYLDPPYQHATGYPVTCPRDQVLAIADEAARHGGRVVLSEAVGLAAELGPGWRQVQLRRGPKPEWVTLYNCPEQAEHGRLFAAGGAA